ncbi:pancreatic lipase-related protein 2-like [Mercenaria mercenaria]|uniref:pancreatic lipase-related protein 2-like n=1 Tax=Mercenaria mercenaria TaxID=6596 RepID=UPI00234E9C39|nr:pancreatic lipase-related protein 2-like [Mercenaria mercenaria]
MEAAKYFWILSLAAVVQLGSCGPHSRPKRSQMCFGELGCFTNEAPFNNTDNLLPQSPALINTTFRLFTETCKRPYILHAGDTGFKSDCNLDPALPLKFVVHGFLQHGQVKWVRDMAAALLNKEPMTVITVDWGSGSGFPYSQAAANTRVVGAEIARLINFLRAHASVSLDKVHIIGHSLGAHIAGYAGERVPGIARITGLDPAEPDYKDTDPLVHLEKTDAEFVDIIHSDGSEFDYVSGFGWIKEVGHIDFYPNGGENQPGCPLESVSNIMTAAYYNGLEDAEDTLSCSHSRSIFLFTESISTDCPFYGHPCNSISDLDSNRGNCLTCPRGVCPEMGYNADRSHARGKFYLRTRSSKPFCGHTQHVEIEFGSMLPTTGQVKVEMIGHDQTSDAVVIRSGTNPFLSGDQRDILVVDRERMSDVVEVRVTFTRPMAYTWWWSSARTTQRSVTIYKVTLTSAEDGRRIHFCGDHRTVTNGNTMTLTRSTTDPNECLHVPMVHVNHHIF